MPREVHTLKRNLHATGKFQRNYCEPQRLTPPTLHNLVQQGDLGFGLSDVILLKAYRRHVSQQGLSEFRSREHRQRSAYSALKLIEPFERLPGIDLAIMLDRDPQCRLEGQRGRASQAVEALLAWIHRLLPFGSGV